MDRPYCDVSLGAINSEPSNLDRFHTDLGRFGGLGRLSSLLLGRADPRRHKRPARTKQARHDEHTVSWQHNQQHTYRDDDDGGDVFDENAVLWVSCAVFPMRLVLPGNVANAWNGSRRPADTT